uniref:hypothetical protein n=1 Tax=Lysinibacillus sphaericus TaxID=1421 RepID=UPI001F2DC993
LTSVFGMGTGVTSLPSSLDYLKDKIHYNINYYNYKLFFKNSLVLSKLDKRSLNVSNFFG